MSKPKIKTSQFPPSFLTVEQARIELQLSRAGIYRRLADGTIKCFRIGKLIRIPRVSIEKMASVEGEQ
jgi:excisionase family DNA binding protein